MNCNNNRVSKKLLSKSPRFHLLKKSDQGIFPLGYRIFQAAQRRIIMETGEWEKPGSERSSEDKSSQSILPLALASEGESLGIIFLRGGRGFHEKLVSMGLNVGDEIEVIQRRGGGTVMIAKEGIRYGLGGGMAQKILVAII
jgi:ferrous iron transport protein A